MKIAVIGTGNIGKAIGALWSRAGHVVTFSSRNPGLLAPFVASLGGHASAGTVEEAARGSEVALLAVPLHAVPALSEAIGASLRGKTILDACNPYPDRDGAIAVEAVANGRGSGEWTASRFPESRIVKAFNTIYFKDFMTEAHRQGPRLAVPLAGDSAEALAVAEQLVRDAGFEPLVVGALARTREFDVGKGPYGKSVDVNALRAFFPSAS